MRTTFDPSIDPGAYRFCHRMRARFAETDAMGIVHHAAYLLYLEEARVEYLRSVGHPFDRLRTEGYELPVAGAAVRYLHPLAFDDLVDVHLVVGRTAGAAFEIGYLLTVGAEPRATAVTRHGVIGPHRRPVRCPDWLVALASSPSSGGSLG